MPHHANIFSFCSLGTSYIERIKRGLFHQPTLAFPLSFSLGRESTCQMGGNAGDNRTDMTRDFEDVGNRKRRASAWLAALVLAPALVAAPLNAMQNVAPPQVSPTLPPAPAAAPIPIPVLSPAQ